MNGEKLFYGTATVIAFATTVILLLMGPAEGAEPADATATIEYSDSMVSDTIKTYEFTPKTASAMQCIYVDGDFAGGVFCWPKIMNDQFQDLIERLKAGER